MRNMEYLADDARSVATSATSETERMRKRNMARRRMDGHEEHKASPDPYYGGEDEDHASVTSSWTARTAMSADNRKTFAPETIAFENALCEKLPSNTTVRAFVADAMVEFIARVAERADVNFEALLFYFSNALLFRIRDAGKGGSLARVPFGDVVRKTLSYPVGAAYVMNRSEPLTAGGDMADEIADLASLLDRDMPVRAHADESITFAGRSLSRLALRCAIPYRFGLTTMIPNKMLNFLCAEFERGEVKTVGIALNEFRDRIESMTDVATQYSMQALMEVSTFKEFMMKLPTLIQVAIGLGLHSDSGTGYQVDVPLSAVKAAVRKREEVVPSAKGSILRAFAREKYGIEVDEREPRVRRVQDCVV